MSPYGYHFAFIATLLVSLSFPIKGADSAAALNANLTALRSASDPVRLAALRNIRQTAETCPEAAQALAGLLHDKNAEIRAGAARALGELGSVARDYLSAISSLLSDGDSEVRRAAVYAVGRIGVPLFPNHLLGEDDAQLAAIHGQIACALAHLLTDESAAVRAYSAEALGRLGPAAESTRPNLRECLADSDRDTAVNAALTLASFGEIHSETPHLYIAALERGGIARTASQRILLSLGAPAVEALRVALLNPEKETYRHREVATLLGRFGALAAPAQEALCKALSDPDLQLQNCAAQSLAQLGTAPREAAEPLFRALRDDDSFRETGTKAFLKMSGHPEQFLLSIIDKTGPAKLVADVTSRREAARLLLTLAPAFKENPAPLPPLLADPDSTVRDDILRALGASGAPATALIPPFASALKDASPEVRSQACAQLAALHSEPAALQALAEARVNSAHKQLRNEVGRAILNAGAAARPLVPYLRAQLPTMQPNDRAWACDVLANIGPGAAEAVPELCDCLVKYRDLHDEAMRALVNIGAPAIESLLPLLGNETDNLRNLGVQTLSQIGTPAIPALIKLLSDEKQPLRASAAAACLEHLGPRAAPAVPELMKALQTPDLKFRQAVVNALSRIGAAAAEPLIARAKEEGKLPDDGIAPKPATAALGLAGAAVVQELANALDAERDPQNLRAILSALVRMGPPAAPAIPAILRVAARDFEPKEQVLVWTRSANAFAHIAVCRDDVVNLLFHLLAQKDVTLSDAAASALGTIGNEDTRVPPLTNALSTGYYNYVGHALKPFRAAGWLQLLAEFEKPDPQVRDTAARAFVPLIPDCVPFLLNALDEHPDARIGCILALGEISADAALHPARAAKTAVVIQVRLPALAKAPAPNEPKPLAEAVTGTLRVLSASANANEAVTAIWALSKSSAADMNADTITRQVKLYPNCAPDVQLRALQALAACPIKGQARALVPILPLLLRKPADNQVMAAQQAVLKAAGYCPESVPALLQALSDPDDYARSLARTALVALGADAKSGTARLIEMLGEDTVPANSAATVLRAIGPAAVPQLIEALRTMDIKQRQRVSNVLESFKLDDYVAQLNAVLDDLNPDAVVAAMYQVRKLGPVAKACEPKLRKLMSSPNADLFQGAFTALRAMQVDVSSALATALDSPDEALVQRALNGLRKEPDHPGDNLPAVVAGLLKKHKTPDVRMACIHLFAARPARAAEFLPHVLATLKDDDEDVRMTALVWLFDYAKTDPQKSLAPLVAALASESDHACLQARRALLTLGDTPRAAIPEITKLLTHARQAVRDNAAAVLVHLNAGGDIAARIHNEAIISARVQQYEALQAQYFESHWTDAHAHYYAAKLSDLFLPEIKQNWNDELNLAAPVFDENGGMTYSGYAFRILLRQSAHAPDGAKEFLNKDKLLTGGQALLAFPIAPGKTGSLAFLAGPSGAIYRRAIKPEETALLPTLAASFDPVPEWTILVPPQDAKVPMRHEYFKPQAEPNQTLEF